MHTQINFLLLFLKIKYCQSILGDKLNIQLDRNIEHKKRNKEHKTFELVTTNPISHKPKET